MFINWQPIDALEDGITTSLNPALHTAATPHTSDH